MDNILQNKNILSTLISENQSVGIVVSEKQNADVLAAALSLHLIFQDSGKSSQIVSRTDPTVEFSSLVGIDQLKKNFGGVTKLLTVSFPYNDGDIEKVSYNIEGDKLNVNLFAEEKGIRFSESDIKYIRQGSSPQLIFTIGIENPAELEGLTEGSSKTINIDNSVANSLYGDVVLVDSSYSSISEIVARLSLDLNLQIEFDVAQNLLDGITFGTNNFSSPKTSGTAFEMAGVLIQKGAVRRDIKGGQVNQSGDVSINMLGNSQGQKQFQQTQSKQFGGQKPLDSVQGKPFGKPQGKPPGGHNPYNKAQAFNQSRSQNNQYRRDEFVQQPKFQSPAGGQHDEISRSNVPSQPRPIEDVTPAPQFDSSTNNSSNIPEIPTEEQAPSDWFTPKVFKSNKN
jgi:hypothetical protein